MASRNGYFSRPDGLKLHYREYGTRSEAPPLLCLHGLTRNARDFHDFAVRMAKNHHVIVLDFRGRGLSARDPDPSRYVPLTYVHDVIGLLDHLGIADAIIVGTSLGGIVAMLLAIVDEDRIAATILNDVGPELNDAGIERIRGYVGVVSQYDNWTDAARAAKTMNRGLPAHRDEADWVAMARRLMSETAAGAIVPDYDPAIAIPFKQQPSDKVDMWPLFDALAQKPVLVLRGGESDLLDPDVLERMEARSPNVRVATLPGVPHSPDLDETEAIAAIDRFLDSVDA